MVFLNFCLLKFYHHWHLLGVIISSQWNMHKHCPPSTLLYSAHSYRPLTTNRCPLTMKQWAAVSSQHLKRNKQKLVKHSCTLTVFIYRLEEMKDTGPWEKKIKNPQNQHKNIKWKLVVYVVIMKGFAYVKEGQNFVFFSHPELTFLFFCRSTNGLCKKTRQTIWGIYLLSAAF